VPWFNVPPKSAQRLNFFCLIGSETPEATLYWGHPKKVIAEADLFTIEPENEMYAHMNSNYLQLKKNAGIPGRLAR
jgi:hypothetical protein